MGVTHFLKCPMIAWCKVPVRVCMDDGRKRFKASTKRFRAKCVECSLDDCCYSRLIASE